MKFPSLAPAVLALAAAALPAEACTSWMIHPSVSRSGMMIVQKVRDHYHARLDADMEDCLSDVVVDMNLKYNKVFSVIDIDDATYQKWRGVTPFYQNLDREGVVLWTAA